MKKSNQYVLKIVGCMVFVMICDIGNNKFFRARNAW